MEQLHPTRTALLVVDMQWQYFDPTSPVCLDGGDDLVARTIGFASRVRDTGAHVVWTATHLRPGVPVGRTTKRFPYKEENRATWSTLASPIEPDATDILIYKPRHSAFYGTDLDVVLRSLNCTDVVVAGITSNVCCFATALDAAARDYTVWWVDDLIRALPISRPGFQIDALTVHRHTTAMVAYSVGSVVESRAVLRALGVTD